MEELECSLEEMVTRQVRGREGGREGGRAGGREGEGERERERLVRPRLLCTDGPRAQLCVARNAACHGHGKTACHGDAALRSAPAHKGGDDEARDVELEGEEDADEHVGVGVDEVQVHVQVLRRLEEREGEEGVRG